MTCERRIEIRLAACVAVVAIARRRLRRVRRARARSPSQLVITSLRGGVRAPSPDEFGGTLHSDVITIVERTVNGQQATVPTIFNDLGPGRRCRSMLKDPGTAGTAGADAAQPGDDHPLPRRLPPRRRPQHARASTCRIAFDWR